MTQPKSIKRYYASLPKHQKELVDYHKKDVPIEKLNPSLNKYNSVRYQFLKHSGNYISDSDIDWKCKKCGKLVHINQIHYHEFDKPNRQGKPTSDFVRVNDSRGIGMRANTAHILHDH